jgi:hypothetical protein
MPLPGSRTATKDPATDGHPELESLTTICGRRGSLDISPAPAPDMPAPKADHATNENAIAIFTRSSTERYPASRTLNVFWVTSGVIAIQSRSRIGFAISRATRATTRSSSPLLPIAFFSEPLSP